MFIKLTQILEDNKSEILININHIVGIRQVVHEKEDTKGDLVSRPNCFIDVVREKHPSTYLVIESIDIVNERILSSRFLDAKLEIEPKDNDLKFKCKAPILEPDDHRPVENLEWRTTPPPRDRSIILVNFTRLTYLMDPEQTYMAHYREEEKAWCSGESLIHESINKHDPDKVIDPTRWLPFSDLQRIRIDRRG